MAIIRCPDCGANNRVDESRAQSQQPVCGRCGQKLPVPAGQSSGPVEVTDQSLSELLNSAGDRPVLVDCWAAWCGPCRMIAPMIDELAAESHGRWVIGKLNVDQNQRTAAQFQIDAIPALLLFRGGKLVDKIVGVQPKQAIASRLMAA